MDAAKKPSKPLIPFLKPIIYSLSSVVAAGLITYSMIRLSSALDGFSLDVLLSPIRCGYTVLLKTTIMYVLSGVILIIVGIRKKNLWYLMPIGLVTLAAYWLMSSLFVVKMITTLMEK